MLGERPRNPVHPSHRLAAPGSWCERRVRNIPPSNPRLRPIEDPSSCQWSLLYYTQKKSCSPPINLEACEGFLLATNPAMHNAIERESETQTPTNSPGIPKYPSLFGFHRSVRPTEGGTVLSVTAHHCFRDSCACNLYRVSRSRGAIGARRYGALFCAHSRCEVIVVPW